jgi:hypothetical protein
MQATIAVTFAIPFVFMGFSFRFPPDISGALMEPTREFRQIDSCLVFFGR